MKTLVCRNSKCQREFTPDSDHRCLPYCCPMCQREATATPRPRGRAVLPTLTNTLIAKPQITRKHAAQNKRQTE